MPPHNVRRQSQRPTACSAIDPRRPAQLTRSASSVHKTHQHAVLQGWFRVVDPPSDDTRCERVKTYLVVKLVLPSRLSRTATDPWYSVSNAKGGFLKKYYYRHAYHSDRRGSPSPNIGERHIYCPVVFRHLQHPRRRSSSRNNTSSIDSTMVKRR